MMDYITNLIDYNQLIIGGIGFLVAVLTFFAKAIFNFILGKTSNSIIKKVIEKAEHMTSGVIETTYQTVVKQAKIDLKDGKITQVEYLKLLKLAKDTAVSSLISSIGDPLQKVMKSTLAEVKDFCSDLIERKIDEAKK